MLRIGDEQVAGAIGDEIAQVVQGAGENAVPVGQVPTFRASPPLEVTGPSDNLRLRQIFNTRDPFGRVGHILARSGHRDILQKE